MRTPEPIRRLLFRRPELGLELFEELVERYDEEGDPVWREFVSRLTGLVFQAATDYATWQNPAATTADIETLAMRVFEEFKPTFASESGESLLRRFAGVIRRKLSVTAFEKIAFRYYILGPIYHLKDYEQRRLLAAAYQMGLGPGTERKLADMQAAGVADVLKGANRALRQVIKDFPDLTDSTEGYLLPEQFTD